MTTESRETTKITGEHPDEDAASRKNWLVAQCQGSEFSSSRPFWFLQLRNAKMILNGEFRMEGSTATRLFSPNLVALTW